jgi:hypothetical protein
MPKRTDNNTHEIRETAERFGYFYLDTHVIGRGFPDSIIAKPRLGSWEIYFLEIKSAKGRLSPAEQKFHAKYPGLVHIVRTPEDVMKLIREEE